MEFTINPTEKTIKVQGSLEKKDLERLLELLNQLEGYSVVFEQQGWQLIYYNRSER